ncbi:MAG: type IV secretion protein IcmK [Legionella sp.]|nr:type IV secretion protein IcmK [Legionella sp.]
MNRYVRSLSKLLCFLIAMVPGHFATAGEKQESAQQALQQLRLLQQRLSPDSQQKTQPPADAPSALQAIPGPRDPITRLPLPPQTTQPPQARPAPPPPPPPMTSNEENELVDSKAFEGVARQMFPLTPEQILRLKQMYQTSEFAQAMTAGTPPKPIATSQFVNLSPGSTPPVIRLSQGFVSSLVFLDSTGAPWPISAYDLGDPSSFNIQWDKLSNTLMIQSIKLYTYGNLAIRLRGLNTPVMLTLIPGQKVVDYRVDLRVQGLGPNAKAMRMVDELPSSANDLLLRVLDGVPPPGSHRLVVSGGDARAWLLRDKMYVRTDLTILSPAWLASMTSADGMHAYEMQKSPVLLVSWHGKVMQLKIEGL